MNIPNIKLAQVVDRFEQIESRLGVATDSNEIVQLGKDYAELKPVVEGVRKLQSIRIDIDDLEIMLMTLRWARWQKKRCYHLKINYLEIEKEVSSTLTSQR